MHISRVGSVLGAALLAGFVAAPLVQAADIDGTAGSDRLVGTPNPDRIRGLGGADWVSARNAGDVVYGGTGADELHGRGGRDFVSGGKGRDLVLGEGAFDRLFGDFGNDVVRGGGGGDYFGNPAPNIGFEGDDTLIGGGGRDVLMEDGNGNDVLRGGPNKKIVTSPDIFGTREFLSPAGGADRVFGGAGPDIVYLESDGRRDIIRCGPGDDEVSYNKGRDRRDVISGCEKIRDHQ